ncbi:neuronal acetylcholine receptor subunit alpha-9 [Lingula anatina]|uniref:Neuronal acetylcholine receptor subunit alpha-9 n=1 Tax=Lingula anatina TaxID=7574 RepID=A0A1S3K4A6_LINAN|nr:neuronal acetylcholine receptor subunit alpha-9 [Lingula anatina]|eukprot:XP_013417357.1 neuronal acetylcholine receptor subunit alpha-9 [Lingula anatina]
MAMETPKRALFFLLTVCACQIVSTSGRSVEYKNLFDLKKSLLSTYDTNLRPVLDPRDAVNVSVDISINQVIELNAAEQILFVSIWLRQSWRDELLTWNASEYSNQTMFDVAISSIWRPDLTIYNDVREEEREITSYPAYVLSDGIVHWNTPIILKSSCIMDIYHFPYDKQRCPIKFGSWHYHGFQLNVINKTAFGDTSSFVRNGQWELGIVPAIRTVEYYACCEEPYPDVTFHLVLCRKPLYYVFNLILPCIVILIMTGISFYLPVESGEKVSFGVTAVLALMVFLQLVSDLTPTQSEVVPVLSMYLGCVLLLICVSTLSSIMVTSVHYRGEHGQALPFWMEKLFLNCLGRVVCFKGAADDAIGDDVNIDSDPYKWLTKKLSDPNLRRQSRGSQNGDALNISSEYNNPAFQADVRRNLKSRNNNEGNNEEMVLVLQNIHRTLQGKDAQGRATKTDERSKLQWRFTATIIDRFVLYIYVFVTIALTAWFFSMPPACNPAVIENSQ